MLDEWLGTMGCMLNERQDGMMGAIESNGWYSMVASSECGDVAGSSGKFCCPSRR